MSTRQWIGGNGSGPNDWSVAANWSGGAVPVASDDVYIDTSIYDITAGLNQSTVTLATLNISQLFSNVIGTASAYLQISASVVNVGYNYGSSTSQTGSPLIKIDLGSVAAVINEQNSCTFGSLNGTPIQYLGSSITTINGNGGTFSVAASPLETATITTVNGNGASFSLGKGVTVTTVVNNGGVVVLNCAATTVSQSSGTLTTNGSGAITTLNVYSGNAVLNSTGTIGTLNAGGAIDFSQNIASRTVTATNVLPGYSINLGETKSIITFTGAINPGASSLSQGSITFAAGQKLSIS